MLLLLLFFFYFINANKISVLLIVLFRTIIYSFDQLSKNTFVITASLPGVNRSPVLDIIASLVWCHNAWTCVLVTFKMSLVGTSRGGLPIRVCHSRILDLLIEIIFYVSANFYQIMTKEPGSTHTC